MCLMMSNKVLSQLGMPVRNHTMHDAFNQELLREKMYNLDALSAKITIEYSKQPNIF